MPRSNSLYRYIPTHCLNIVTVIYGSVKNATKTFHFVVEGGTLRVFIVGRCKDDLWSIVCLSRTNQAVMWVALPFSSKEIIVYCLLKISCLGIEALCFTIILELFNDLYKTLMTQGIMLCWKLESTAMKWMCKVCLRQALLNGWEFSGKLREKCVLTLKL